MIRVYLIILLLCTVQLLLAEVSPDSILTYSVLQDKIEKAIETKKTDSLAYFYDYLGDNRLESSLLKEAIEAYDKSLKYFNSDDSLLYYSVSIKKVEVFQDGNNEKELLKTYQKALNYFKKSRLKSARAHIHAKLANWYKNKGMTQEQNNHLDESIILNSEVKDTLLDIIVNIEKAELNHSLNYYKKSLKATNHSLALSETIGNEKYIALNKLRKGLVLSSMNDYDQALPFIYESQQLLLILDDPYLLLDMYRQTHDNFHSENKYELAYHYQTLHTQLKDSLYEANEEQKIQEWINQNEAKEKDREIEELRNENIKAEVADQKKTFLLYSFYFAGLVALISLYFIIRFFQEQIRIKETVTQQNEEINRQKIVELENNLKIETMHSMLSGQEAERERIAKDLHDSLGGLLSTVKLQFEFAQSKVPELDKKPGFVKVNNLLDEACQEVRNISNNMQPGSLNKLGLVAAVNDLINRFQGEQYPEIDFQNYGMEHKLGSTTQLMVYRIIQELLTNSIKHAEASEIIIQLTRKENELIIMVEDDGVGFDIEKSKKGMGTGNIASRVNFLKGDLSIHSIKNNGTSTMITVPLDKQLS